MLRFRNTFVVLLLLASLPCGCSTAEREEWDRAWSKPWFGSSSGIGKPEPWTIECNAYEGPNRRAMADRMATLLKKVPELSADDVWVEHARKQSRVFCGIYQLRYVEAETDGKDRLRGDVIIQLNDRVKRDLAFVRQLALGEEHPFFSARPIRKPIPDVGPPEWNLRNAKGVYTLNIGITYPSPTLHNYKEAALAWVGDLRERGYEAYYYHDPDKSRTSICIGTFGEDAFQRDSRGRTGYGSVVKRLQSKDQFKYNLENGYKVYKVAINPETSRKERIPNYSFLVKIPGGEERGSTPREVDCDLGQLPHRVGSKRKSLAVLGFADATEYARTTGRALGDLCRVVVHQSAAFTLIDRENMAAILGEQDLAAAIGCSSTECRVEYGKLLSAQSILYGRVSNLGGSVVVYLSITDVETARIEAVITERVASIDSLANAIPLLMCRLLHQALDD